MKKNKSFFSSLRWIFEVSNRFSYVDRKGRSAITNALSTLGICFGVMTLISVVGVMNGFQMSFIDSIMEISSYHVRIKNVKEEDFPQFRDFCSSNKNVETVSVFYESQGLMVGRKNRETPVIVRGVDSEIMSHDKGFEKEAKIVRGKFDLSQKHYIVLGSELAKSVGAVIGSKVNLLALSGGSDVDMISHNRQFYVTGIFESGYLDINQAYSFINTESAKENFGKASPLLVGIKLKDYNNDFALISEIDRNFEELKTESWREFNRTFFGALRVEKNILMLLVLIIFLVVGVNIYNGMRRLVFERKQEISILSALGGTKQNIHSIFILKGFISGLKGSVSGVVLGLLITANMNHIFVFASKVMYYGQLFFTMLINPSNSVYVRENPMFQVYASIPARVEPFEVLIICLFGMAAPLFASWWASHSILKMEVAEVLHDE